MEEAHLREVGGEPLDLDQHGAGLAVQVAALDRDLDVGPLALAQVADRVVAVLGGREQDAVVARPAVVAAVVDVGVEAVLVDGLPPSSTRRRISCAGLYELGTSVQPVAATAPPAGTAAAGEAGRVVELEAERGGERGRVVGGAM